MRHYQPYVPRVDLTKHVRERWAVRGTRHRISGSMIARHVAGALRAGVRPRSDGTIRIGLPEGRVAVCAPSPRGGWVAITVLQAQEANVRGTYVLE